jgi:hypothetical protein
VQFALTVLWLEDKIVQQAVATVLEAIYEEDFLGFSYGFRPGRGQHDPLDADHPFPQAQSAFCALLQDGSRSALSKMDAEHAAYVALRKVRSSPRRRVT